MTDYITNNLNYYKHYFLRVTRNTVAIANKIPTTVNIKHNPLGFAHLLLIASHSILMHAITALLIHIEPAMIQIRGFIRSYNSFALPLVDNSTSNIPI